MKVVLQRVRQASVSVEGREVGKIGRGICLLVGVEKGDTIEEARYLARKVVELRIFPDEKEKMNLSLLDVGGEVLAVSQFTLVASTKKGRRPGFDRAEEPGKAAELFGELVTAIRGNGVKVETGVFQTVMDVHLINEGPVTFILESKPARADG